MPYDADCKNKQAVRAVFQRHLEDGSRMIRRHFEARPLEVGCGKGYFLEQLQPDGFEVTGLDPPYEGSNPPVMREYFSPGLWLRADGIILRHVLEHVQDPVSFLSSIRGSNGGRGKIYIEVLCFDWICAHCAWFDIFCEHVNYFRLADFHRMFGKVLEEGHTFGGQYLYAVGDLASIRRRCADDQDVFSLPAGFMDAVTTHAGRLNERRDDHVRAELKAYAPLTSVRSYSVVFDTIVEDRPADMFPDRPWEPGNNPKTAVWEYLKIHPEFDLDKQMDAKLLISVAPDGYLKRTR
jgi:SAM-dependent methyltransferase